MTEDRFVELLQQAVEKVKTEEDPVELNQYRKLFKKNVPFALRMYVAAYLAKNAAGGRDSFRNRRDRTENRRNREEKAVRTERAEREPRENREPAPRVEIPEDQAATIFISIGRNRRVFPRDLIGLIVTHSNIDRARIGDIRVLDNYSFVQLYAEDCATVIDSLNGTSFRGRKLNVSYSHKKDEENGETASAAPAEDDGQTAFFPPENEDEKSVYDEIQPETNGSSNYLV